MPRTRRDNRPSGGQVTPRPSSPSRRDVLELALVGGASATAAFVAAPAGALAATTAARGTAYRLTVLGTTDTRGAVFNWDYYADAEYDDAEGNDIGLAKLSSLVTAVRHERGSANTLLVDGGDILRGTLLAHFYATVDPVTGDSVHPMATAMNLMGYDAAAVGSHDLDYGPDTLRAFQSQCQFPLLCGNALDSTTAAPAFAPYVVRQVWLTGAPAPVSVGILGLVTPQITAWDDESVEGQLSFLDVTQQARHWVPRLKAAGCDVVVVLCPGAVDKDNAALDMARRVAGVDAVLVSHPVAAETGPEIVEQLVESVVTKGKRVLLTQPRASGMRLSVMDLDLARDAKGWRVTAAHSHLLDTAVVAEDPAMTALLGDDHAVVRTYANSVIGTSRVALSAATARFEHSDELDFVNHVQGQTVKDAISGTPDEVLPVLSATAPFARGAGLPSGDVTVRDVGGLYPSTGTVLAVRLSGAGLTAYVEQSAAYFQSVDGSGPFTPDEVAGAPSVLTGLPVPDSDYDVLAGVDAALTYDIDLSRAAGSRVSNLLYDGQPVDPTDEVIVAMDSRRRSGAFGFSALAAAPVVYDGQREIRQLLVDWVTAQGVIDPSTFPANHWRLVAGTDPVVVVR
jgi:2',3'-cyclic-nucleotide 2'-phosphodiesterase/3'-nucleotidase